MNSAKHISKINSAGERLGGIIKAGCYSSLNESVRNPAFGFNTNGPYQTGGHRLIFFPFKLIVFPVAFPGSTNKSI
jgi:hypothetical protein